MATIKLNKNKPASDKPSGTGPRRAPVRGGGGVGKPRPTLAQAQADRAERQAAYEQRRSEESQDERRPGGRPDQRFDQRGPGRGDDRGGRGGDRGGRPGADRRGDPRQAGPRGGRPEQDRGPRGPGQGAPSRGPGFGGLHNQRDDHGSRYTQESRAHREDRYGREDRFAGGSQDRQGPRGDRPPYGGDRSQGRYQGRDQGRDQGGYQGGHQGGYPRGNQAGYQGGNEGRYQGGNPSGNQGRYSGGHQGGYQGGGYQGGYQGRGPGGDREGYQGRGQDRGPDTGYRGGPRGDGRASYGGPGRPDDRYSRQEGQGPARDGRYERPAPAGSGRYGEPSRDDRPHGPRAIADRPAGHRYGAEADGDHEARPRQPAPQRLADPSEGERLSKRMSELGLASRREADEWIDAGWVTVDGKMAELGQRVGPDVKIEIDPAAREQQSQRVTILLHKPIGYVSGQAEDGYEPASVLVKADTHWSDDPASIHWAPGHGRNLAPAGRLDIDSTGLLVLTQDGRIARHLIGEDSTVEKEYLVRVAMEQGPSDVPAQHQLDPRGLALLNHGLELDGVELKPAKVSWANEDQLRFVLREGRKRQIRRMCEMVGLKVLALKRVRIGRIPLGQLPAGQWRYLAPWERF